MRRRPQQPFEDIEPTFVGEPDPIVFGQPAADGEAQGEGIERIVFPVPGQPPPVVARPTTRPARPAKARSGRSGLIRGLVLGCLIGGAVGGFVALALDRLQSRPPSKADPAPMAQAMIPTMRPEVQTPPAAELGVVAPPPAALPERHGLDFGALAAAIGLRAPDSPTANAPAPVPVTLPPEAPIGLRQGEGDPPRLPPMVTAAPKAPPDPPPPVIAPAPAERLALGPITPPSAQPKAAPSFDCAGARSRAEQAVCGDPGLALADRRLNQAYDRAMASAPDRAALHDDQARWLAERDALGADHSSLSAAYEARIQTLAEQDRRNRRGPLRRLPPR
jgi:uncharacterized protein YecT (DUF1311 family)